MSAVPGPLIWINTCEPSGDLHGALLTRAIRHACPATRFAGMGGPAMERENVDLALRMEGLSVMGVSEVFGYLPRVIGLWREIRRRLKRLGPSAMILVDSPDFHFRVARMAHGLGIPVFYYISPQVWAWRPGRVKFLKKHIRRMICILPFEQEFYRSRGMAADYVGHPLVDQVRRPEVLALSPKPRRVGILPGSRKSEIQRLMPVYGETIRLVHQHSPDVEFVIIKAPGMSETFIRRSCPADLKAAFLDPDRRWSHMRECAMLLATSGTVTLESSLLGVPTIVAYKCSRLSFMVGVRLIKVPAISLTNLILRADVLPEFIQHQAHPANLANMIRTWLQDGEEIGRVRRALAGLPGLLGDGGAAGRAADIILRDLGAARDEKPAAESFTVSGTPG